MFSASRRAGRAAFTNAGKRARLLAQKGESTRGMRAIAALGAGASVLFAAQAVLAKESKEIGAAFGLPPLTAAARAGKGGKRRADLPEMTTKQVREAKDRVLVTFNEGVYDVTKFVAVHPGGEKILLAAGGALEPFWALYAQHKTEEITEMLEVMRVANLKYEKGEQPAVVEDLWAGEPQRSPILEAHVRTPFNAETPGAILADKFFTPNEIFYVRNHLPVPDEITAEEFVLTVEGKGIPNPVKISWADLRGHEEHSVVATLSCAGNRRKQLQEVKPIAGLPWKLGAIGNAEWTGVRLAEVLMAAGFSPKEAQHVQFEGRDIGVDGLPYGASVPVNLALHPDALLAYKMNGEPLSRDHGAPLRVVIPGVTGARNVKRLETIRCAEEEADSLWQRKDYKVFNPDVVDRNLAKWDEAPAIQAMPVTSAICEPVDGAKIEASAGEVSLRGYAWSGGGNDIQRVDITSDGGKSWAQANLEVRPVEQKSGRAWAWKLWSAQVPITEDIRNAGKVRVCAKAVDCQCNTQPERPEVVWNLRGCCNNAWHCVDYNIGDAKK